MLQSPKCRDIDASEPIPAHIQPLALILRVSGLVFHLQEPSGLLLKHVMQDSTRREDRVSIRLADLCSLDCGLHTADGGFETLRGENPCHQLAGTTTVPQGSVESLQTPFSPRIPCWLGDGSMGCLSRISGLGLCLTIQGRVRTCSRD